MSTTREAIDRRGELAGVKATVVPVRSWIARNWAGGIHCGIFFSGFLIFFWRGKDGKIKERRRGGWETLL